MKKSSLLMIISVILLTACGTASQYAGSTSSARFEDGIYSSGPSFISKEARDDSQKETEALIEKTKESAIYLFGEKKDTVMIPENMSASIRYDKGLGSTVITVGENPYDWQNYIDPWGYYTPYSIGSSWYWSRHYNPWYSGPIYWNSWAYSPWRYSGWYDPWYYSYGGWYDPWYYGGIYSSWYYGYGGWYGYMGPHYAGWYGGWDPYWHHHHHHHPPHHGSVIVDDRPRAGSRREATGSRVNGITSSARRGAAFSSRVSQELKSTSVNAADNTGSASRPARVSSPGTVKSETGTIKTVRAVRTTPSTVKDNGAVTRPTAVKQPAQTQNYRKPKATVSTGTASGSSRPVVSNSENSSSSSRQSTTVRQASEYRSSRTSSYNSSSSSSRSSSFSSGSGFSSGSSGRSSSGGSRSSGYSSGRR